MKPAVQNVFDKELSKIKDTNIFLFVTQIFDKLCPSYFWYIPASVRGPHLPICRTLGGLVQHTKLTVRFAHSFMEMWPDAPETSHDEVIAACLLHDILKCGKAEYELLTFASHKLARASHGVYCAARIKELWEQDRKLRALIPEDRAFRIITAIRDHMGKWTHGFVRNQEDIVRNTQEGHIVCITVHLADYAASRPLSKWIGERHTDKTMEYLKSLK